MCSVKLAGSSLNKYALCFAAAGVLSNTKKKNVPHFLRQVIGAGGLGIGGLQAPLHGDFAGGEAQIADFPGSQQIRTKADLPVFDL